MTSAFLQELAAFRAFLDGLPVYCWMQGDPDRVEWINAALSAVFATRQSGSTLGVEQLIHRRDMARVRNAIAAGMSSKRAFSFEFRIARVPGQKGADRWCVATMFPLVNEQNPHAWLAMALEADGRYREVAEHVPAMIWSTDATGAMNYANAAWFEAFRVPPDVANASGFSGIIHPDQRQSILDAWKRATEKGAAFEAPVLMRMPDGEYRQMLAQAVPIYDADGAIDGWAGTTVDIQNESDRSARRNAEVRRFLDTLPDIAWSAVGASVAWYNRRWFEYTGLSPEESVANGWALAIHPDDLPALYRVTEIAIRDGTPLESEFRLRGRDGQYRWHLCRGEPLFDEDGSLLSFIGTSTNIDTQKRVEQQLRFTVEASDLLSGIQETTSLVEALASLAVPRIADFALFGLFDRTGTLKVSAVRHRDPSMQGFLVEFNRLYPPGELSAVYRAIRSGKAELIERVDDATIAKRSIDQRQYDMARQLDTRSLVTVPIIAGGTTFGGFYFARAGDSAAYSEEDLRFAELLGRRIGAALENIRVYERERNIADTFQRAALPKNLPQLPGLTLSAVYRAAEDEARVGGDWYDAFVLDDGRLIVVVGDVTGKGLEAAVTMANVRQNIRLAAYEGHDPAGILSVVDRALRRDTPQRLVTAFVGIIDRQSSRMTFANAGHPWPVVRNSDGTLSTLAGSDPPLGLLYERPVARAVPVPANSILVLYTDGLVEATRNLLEGERWLDEALKSDAVAHASNPARHLFDSMIGRAGEQRDDVAILTIATGRSIHWSFNAEDAMSAQGARSSFMELLRESGEGDWYAAELIFGELVGNVVRHAPGTIDIALDWNEERPVLHVLDSGLGFDAPPVRLPDDAFSETSRGLYLIATLGADFSVQRLPGRGSHTRVTLPVRRISREQS